MDNQVYSIARDPANARKALGCIDLVDSPDDGGWYAHQYDFTRADGYTRTSARIYPSCTALRRALDSGKHRWKKWD